MALNGAADRPEQSTNGLDERPAPGNLAAVLNSAFALNTEHPTVPAQVAKKEPQRIIAPLPSRSAGKIALRTKTTAQAESEGFLDRHYVSPQEYNEIIERGLRTQVLPVTFRPSLSPYAFARPELAVTRYAERLLAEGRANDARAGKQREQAWKGYTMPAYSEAGEFKRRLDELFGAGDMLRGFGKRPMVSTGVIASAPLRLHTVVRVRRAYVSGRDRASTFRSAWARPSV